MSPIPLLVLRSFGGNRAPTSPAPLSFGRILVPIAQMPSVVGPYVQEFARLFGSQTLLLHVAEPGIDGRVRKSRLEEIRLLSESLSRAGIPTEVHQREGNPAEEILDCAQSEGAALIAMTTHGPSGPTRWSLGSVTEKVLHSATIPLLLFRSQPGGPEP